MTTQTATSADNCATPETSNKVVPTESMDDFPLVLTAKAAEKIMEALKLEGEQTGKTYVAVRVSVVGGGCSGFQYDLYFDEPAEGDQSFTSNGVRLVCDQMSFMYLMGTQIDYVEGLQGAGFKFGNPNTTGSCGCGSSFSV